MRPETLRKVSRTRTPRPGASNPWRVLVEWSFVGLLVSGATWLVARYGLVTETDFGSVTPPWASKVLAIHGALAMLSLVAIGAWLPMHVLPRLRQRLRLVTGIAQVNLLALIVVTGYGLYYLADEDGRPTWSTVHWAGGVILAALLLIHRRAGRDDLREAAALHRRHGGHRGG